MTIEKEKKIINNVLKGDTVAFSQIVDAYKNMVFTLALRMTKNREEAEEISQDVFIKVYKSLNKFKFDSKFSTWIYKITYNTCLDTIKKNKKFINNIAIDETNNNKLAMVDNALEKLIKEERSQLIRRCVNKLPQESRALMTLFYFEELSLLEISEITGLSTNTAKVKLHRARKRLVGIMEQYIIPQNKISYGT